MIVISRARIGTDNTLTADHARAAAAAADHAAAAQTQPIPNNEKDSLQAEKGAAQMIPATLGYELPAT